MPLLKGKENIGHNIKEMENAGHPHKQAVAAALNEAGESKKGKDAQLKRREPLKTESTTITEHPSGGKMSRTLIKSYEGQSSLAKAKAMASPMSNDEPAKERMPLREETTISREHPSGAKASRTISKSYEPSPSLAKAAAMAAGGGGLAGKDEDDDDDEKDKQSSSANDAWSPEARKAATEARRGRSAGQTEAATRHGEHAATMRGYGQHGEAARHEVVAKLHREAATHYQRGHVSKGISAEGKAKAIVRQHRLADDKPQTTKDNQPMMATTPNSALPMARPQVEAHDDGSYTASDAWTGKEF